MKKKLIHLVNSISVGGLEQGIATLLKNGFYDPFDFRIIELFRGAGPIRDDIVHILGRDRVVSLRGEEKHVVPSNAAVRHAYRLLEVASLGLSLQRTFRKIGPGAVIFSSPMAHVVGRSVTALFSNIMAVSFEHGTTVYSPAWKTALRLTSLRSDAILADAEETLKYQISSSYLKTPRVAQVVPLFVLNTEDHHCLRDPDTFRILSLGRLSPEKNYPELIHAVSGLIREGYRLELTIAGEGPRRQELETIIAGIEAENPNLGIAQLIKLPGHVSNKNGLKALRDAADIYVQPSLREGFCLAAAEALAAGIPTAVTDFAGMHTYGNSRDIITIRGYSREHIADALRHMVKNYKSIAPGMSCAAVETVQSLFGVNVVREQWQVAIEMLMSERKPSLPASAPPYPKVRANFGAS